jgi:hypothetical protein
MLSMLLSQVFSYAGELCFREGYIGEVCYLHQTGI